MSCLRFAPPASLPLGTLFDGGRLTSDGGLPWLSEAEELISICAGFAEQISDWRRRKAVRHSIPALVRQRVFQIACGYEDQNDADTLRGDPLSKIVCGQLPETDADLASQPTLSRLENAVDWRTCYHLAVAMVEVYLRERERQGDSHPYPSARGHARRSDLREAGAKPTPQGSRRPPGCGSRATSPM